MKKGIIIGAGFAGLSAASFLAAGGFSAEVIEASPKPGGRAYSFFDEKFGFELDNGQHLLMGCYTETLRFMKLIGAYDNLIIQKSLAVNYIDSKGNKYFLKSSSLPYPLNLLSALLDFKALTFNERISVIKFFSRLPFRHNSSFKNLSVREWLCKEGMSFNTISSLWELIAVSALNTNIDKADAAMFYEILKRIFLNGNFSTKIIFPKYGLSKTYCRNAIEFIKKQNGNVSLSEKVVNLKIEKNKISEIHTSKRIIKDFDFVISSTPLYSAEKYLPGIENYIDKYPPLNYSSIVSVHIKLKNNPLNERYYGFISSPVHWVFNKKEYITVVISDADYIVNKEKEEIFSIVITEIEKFLGIREELFLEYRVIKEKRATFIPSGTISAKRPGFMTKIDNFFVAGDWINTGLPSTIESAVKSGKIICDYIISNFS